MNRAGIHIGFLVSGLLHIAVLAATALPGTGTVESTPGETPVTLNLVVLEAQPEPDSAQAPEPPPEPPPATPEAVQQPVAKPEPPAPRPRPQPRPLANARPEPQPTAALAEAAPPSTSHSPPQQARRLAETYLAALVKEIERHRFYPRVSRRLNEEGTVVVRFIIQRDGRLTDIAVDNSSGSRRLDEAALQTLGKTTPFEPMPAVLGREQLSLTVPIVYHLQR